MSFINTVKNKIAEYAELRIRLIKLNLIEQVASIAGYFIFSILAVILGFIMLIFLGLALTEWFTIITDGSRLAGTFMTVGFYLILIIILLLLRKTLLKGVAGMVIKSITKPGKDEENN
jgi:hypothetical protein